MTLFDLANEVLKFYRQVEYALEDFDPDDSESIKNMEEDLASLDRAEQDFYVKADAYCWVIDQMRNKARTRQEHANRLEDLAKKDRDTATVLENRLIKMLRTAYPEQNKFILPGHEIRSRKSEAVVVSCVDELPEEFIRVKETKEPDKMAIKAAIQSGQTINGAAIESRLTWRIQ